MTKKFYIALIVMLGFVMMPSMAFACKAKAEKACCKKESDGIADKKACCKTENKTSNKKSCDGACKHVSCTSSVPSVALTSVIYFSLNEIKTAISCDNQLYHYFEIFTSSDFRSIWLPPKIS